MFFLPLSFWGFSLELRIVLFIREEGPFFLLASRREIPFSSVVTLFFFPPEARHDVSLPRRETLSSRQGSGSRAFPPLLRSFISKDRVKDPFSFLVEVFPFFCNRIGFLSRLSFSKTGCELNFPLSVRKDLFWNVDVVSFSRKGFKELY